MLLPPEAHLLAVPTQRLEARGNPVRMDLCLVLFGNPKFTQHLADAHRRFDANGSVDPLSPWVSKISRVLLYRRRGDEFVCIEPPRLAGEVAMVRLGP